VGGGGPLGLSRLELSRLFEEDLGTEKEFDLLRRGDGPGDGVLEVFF
jgi:hypothetical protein